MERLRDRGEEMSARHEAERRSMEEAIREKEALARAGELTAGIAHEVRNGLGTILGYARMLERAGLAEDPAAAARSIREECETLETVVRRFTDFVKLERLQLAPTDLARLLPRVVAREQRADEERAHAARRPRRIRSSSRPTRSSSRGRSRTSSGTPSRPRVGEGASSRSRPGEAEGLVEHPRRGRRAGPRRGPPRGRPALLHDPARRPGAGPPARAQDRAPARRGAPARGRATGGVRVTVSLPAGGPDAQLTQGAR